MLLKNLVKQLKRGQIYYPSKSSRWQQAKGIFALPVDRAVDRPTVKFMTVEPTGRPLGRLGLDPESNGSLAGRPHGRPKLDTESRALCRSTGAFSREQRLTGGRPIRSTGQPAWLRARPVHVGRPDRSTDFCLVDRQTASPVIFRI